MIRPSESAEVRDFYDNFAESYHKARIEHRKLFGEFVEKPAVLSLIKIPPFGVRRTFLDVGCGSGIYSKIFAEMGYFVVGIDISSEMISIAKEYCRGINVDFIVDDFGDHAFDERFDIIYGSFIVGYFAKMEDFFLKAKSALAPDGEIIITMLHPLRVCASEKTDEYYKIENYFGADIYFSQVLEGERRIGLHIHLFSQIIEAAKKFGLYLSSLLEPVPVDAPAGMNAQYYRKLPSIAIMAFREIRK